MANIHIRLSDEKKQEIEDHANYEGISVTAFMLAAANERIAKLRQQ